MPEKGLYRKINSEKLRKSWVKICGFNCLPREHIENNPEIYNKLLPGVEYSTRSYDSPSNWITIYQSDLGFKVMVVTAKNGCTTTYFMHNNTVGIIDKYNPCKVGEINKEKDVKEIEEILFNPSHI